MDAREISGASIGEEGIHALSLSLSSSSMENPIDAYNAFFNERHHDTSMELFLPKARIAQSTTLDLDSYRDGEFALTPSNDGGVSMNLPVVQIELPGPDEKNCVEIRIDIRFLWHTRNVTHVLWRAVIPYRSKRDPVNIYNLNAAKDAPVRHATWWGSVDVWTDEDGDTRAKVALSTRVSMRVLIAQLRYVHTLVVIGRFVKEYAPHLRAEYTDASAFSALFKDESSRLVPDELALRALHGLTFTNEHESTFSDCVDLDQNYMNHIIMMQRVDGDSLSRFIKECSRLTRILKNIIDSTAPWRTLHPADYKSDRTYRFNNSIAPDRWLCVSLSKRDPALRSNYQLVFEDVAFGGRTAFGMMLRTLGPNFFADRTVFLDGWGVRIAYEDILNEQPIVADDESLPLHEQWIPDLAGPDDLGRVFSDNTFLINMKFPTLEMDILAWHVPASHNVNRILDFAKPRMLPFDVEIVEAAMSVAPFKIYCRGYAHPLPDSMTVRDISALATGSIYLIYLDSNWRNDPGFIYSM